jgi:hypothetical protein
MSHFTVLVIGDNVGDQLEKYSEDIQVPEYVTGKVTKKEMKEMIKSYNEDKPLTIGTSDLTLEEEFELFYNEHGEDWDGGECKKIDGVWQKTSTYNPDSKWDWYVVGGRWSGFFKQKTVLETQLAEIGFTQNEFDTLVNLKKTNISKFHETVDKYKGYEDRIKFLVTLYNVNGSEANGRTDSAPKGEIDFEGMRVEGRAEAIKSYEMAKKIFGGAIPKLIITYEQAQEMSKNKKGEVDYGQARDLYWAQSAMKDVQKAREREDLTDAERSFVIWSDISDYQCTKEEYGQKGYDKAVSTYAVVKDGVWYQKSEMGWFGMSNDTSTQEEWNTELNKLIDSVDDNTMFTLIDAHI